jgi:formate dehydrogenase accessory protein FdhE
MNKNPYEARIRRAEYLGKKYLFAKDVLRFYGFVARFQENLRREFDRTLRKSGQRVASTSLRERIDIAGILPHFRAALLLAEKQAPEALAQFSQELRGGMEKDWRALLEEYAVRGGKKESALEPRGEFVARVVTQPLAEVLAEGMEHPLAVSLQCTCVVCGGLPVAGVLRPEGDGGKRFLICGFCSKEWEFRRILCAACAEEDEKRLPVYVAGQLPHLRVEACDSCKRCLRTVDLTKYGNAVPLVDDLAAIPLTLWAEERGYTRIAGNLLGT